MQRPEQSRPAPTLPAEAGRFEEMLTQTLRDRRRWQRLVRSRQRHGEPELAYGRHHGRPPRTARQAGVLLHLYPIRNESKEWAVALTRRSSALPDHPGQICFPGGMQERGETPEMAAKREWEEEMGSPAGDFRIVGKLNTTYVFASNFRVVPIVSVAADAPAFVPNPAEVARVVELPLRVLMEEATKQQTRWRHHMIERSRLRFRAPHIDWDGERIWGATLGMLVELACYLEAGSALRAV